MQSSKTNGAVAWRVCLCNKKYCPYLTTLLSGSPIIPNGKLVGAVTLGRCLQRTNSRKHTVCGFPRCPDGDPLPLRFGNEWRGSGDTKNRPCLMHTTRRQTGTAVFYGIVLHFAFDALVCFERKRKLGFFFLEDLANDDLFFLAACINGHPIADTDAAASLIKEATFSISSLYGVAFNVR